MAKCGFAKWMPITGPKGGYVAGPFRIVHHTTEGSTADGAFNDYRAKGYDPHFTVDDTLIYQHLDTDNFAFSLQNLPGGVETNRLSAVQFEVVGFAEKRKSLATLTNVARLCRWIEATHNVPLVWPNGFPKPATNKGKDPGGHNRNADTWVKLGGHYGHCHVPENVHWDPAYTADEVAFIMSFKDGSDVDPQLVAALSDAPSIAGFVSDVDHHDFA